MLGRASMNVFLRNVDKNLETWALLFFYSLLVTTMAVEVVRRELFSFSSIWGEEIVRYAFIYLVWIGAAAGIRDRAHIRIDVAFTYLRERTKAVFYLLGDFVMLGLSVVALWYSFETVQVSWKFGSVTDGLRLSKVWFLIAVPIGFTLIIYRLVQSILRDFHHLRNGMPVFTGKKMFD